MSIPRKCSIASSGAGSSKECARELVNIDLKDVSAFVESNITIPIPLLSDVAYSLHSDHSSPSI